VASTESRGYRLGPAAAALGARALRDSDLRAAGVPMIRELQRETDETTTLSALVPGGRVYLDQVESRKEIKMTVEIGRRFPLHAGSSGKCMLAFFAEYRREEVLAGDLTAVTEHTVVNANELRAELAEIRHRGYAWSQGERQVGAGSIAAPVFTVDGEVIGALSVCGPSDRVDEVARQQFAPLVLAAADDVSRALGWRGGLPETVAS
jgi:IclR family acetate operon transcriptional repressor